MNPLHEPQSAFRFPETVPRPQNEVVSRLTGHSETLRHFRERKILALVEFEGFPLLFRQKRSVQIVQPIIMDSLFQSPIDTHGYRIPSGRRREL